MAEIRIGGRWRLWDQFSVRGAGFPVDGVQRLAPDGLGMAADRFAAGTRLTGAEWSAYEATFDDAVLKATVQLRDVAAQPEFQAAVGWQNRALLDRAVRPFLKWQPESGRPSRSRQREELISHYWQRFCVKNDTIGFFGPVGWGRIEPGVIGVQTDPGDGLVAETTVYFASWAIDGLAKVIGADPELACWVAPRRVPFIRLTGTEVALPGCQARELGPELSQVLRLCDGARPAVAISDELVRDVTAELTELVRRRLIVWRLDIPADAYPERHLRAWLDRVGDRAARERGLDLLAVLERGRAEVAAADGPAELAETLAALEQDYIALTDTQAAREKGESTAPGRALVYSDARRAATVRLGEDVLAAMAPLDPLLTAATWLTSALAERVLDRARQLFDRSGPVDLATFWFACMPILHSDAANDLAELRALYWAKWASIIAIPNDVSRVDVALSDIADRVAEEFVSTGGGWPAARYLSPDIMIAAVGPDAVARGEFNLVLGELHIAMNTLGASLYLNQHPDVSQLFDLTDVDHPGPRLLPLQAKEHRNRLSTRVRQALIRPQDYCVALVDNTADPHRPRTLASADIIVELRGGELVAVLPDGAVFGVADVFAHVLTTMVVDSFQLMPDTDHTPRVTIDKMVVARETWRFGPDEFAFAEEKSEAKRFVLARQWQARHSLPRFVFIISPAEPRPVFVDFDSPAYVTLLAKAARRLGRTGEGRMTVSEMLPTPEQSWLLDDRGNAYTSELRFVAFDTAGLPDEPAG